MPLSLDRETAHVACLLILARTCTTGTAVLASLCKVDGNMTALLLLCHKSESANADSISTCICTATSCHTQ